MIVGETERTLQTSIIDGNLESSLGVIVVKPMLTVGSAFNHIVLGRDNNPAVSLEHVYSSADESVFIAESHRADTSDSQRRNDLQILGQRIVDLVNYPGKAVDMAFDTNLFD